MPISRHALGYLCGSSNTASTSKTVRCGGGTGDGCARCCPGVVWVNRGRRLLGGRGRIATLAGAEGFELGVAVVTTTAHHTTWVEVGILVKRNLIGAVHVAEDVATLPAVMPACEVVEGAPASGVVAHGRLMIRLVSGIAWSVLSHSTMLQSNTKEKHSACLPSSAS